MTLLKIVLSLALVVPLASAQPRHESHQSAVLLVIASNPNFPSGVIVATSLHAAQIEAAQMTSLDPVCQAVPQVCTARYDLTAYRVFYADGTVLVI